jgi:hypothetical protein
MRLLIAIVLVGCSGPASTPARPPSNQAKDDCTIAVDKVYATLARHGAHTDPGARQSAIDDCRKSPGDPSVACVVAAADDAAIQKCITPAPKGEPGDQLDVAVQQLRTYFFVNETFTDQNIALTPATPCCQFPSKKCPADSAPPAFLVDVLELDFTKERAFQYRFESTSRKAVIEAVGDRACSGKLVTYRRELELRNDGNMHITIDDPK